MDLILCHTTADFDALGAAVGLTCLKPGSKIVLTGGAHPPVRDFLALHRDEYHLIERRSVNPEQIRSLMVVDTQKRARLGKAAIWFDLPNIQEIIVYDHHFGQEGDIPTTQLYLDEVGATTTLMVEELQKNNISLNSAQATVMALGIHVDTGSLTYKQSTARDALALAWLMEQGANLSVISTYRDPGLSPQLQQLLSQALENLEYVCLRGYTIAWVMIKTDDFVPGLSGLASEIIDLTETDAVLLANEYPLSEEDWRLTVIGRTQIPQTNLNSLFQTHGGGGHSQAASFNLRTTDSQPIIQELLAELKAQIPHPPIARDLMSSPVRTIRPETTIAEAQRILLRYGHSGLSVVNNQDLLIGIISRRDLDIALHHGFGHAPVKGYMTSNLKTITPDTSLPEIESLMVTYDIGRLPVLEHRQLVGIVTRTDVLRELHQLTIQNLELKTENNSQKLGLNDELEKRLTPQLWQLLNIASQEAEKRGWHLYLVGGAVRDLLLSETENHTLIINDIDLVVDGFHKTANVGAGVELAKALQHIYQNARLEIHGAFQTAALLWHKDILLDSLWVDIATARTEFYPYPAANPEVEASSIRQDLYRRDFTINAMALRLTSPRAGELLDFFGGFIDLQNQEIKILHPNSFIEDPTRIYRGVRFAVRLGFSLESETENYIRYAINSGVYNRTSQENSKTPALQTRLKTELKYILAAPYWQSALELLNNLGALQCIHPTLQLDIELNRQLNLLKHCLRKFDKKQTLINWQIRLELLIAYLKPEYRGKVAKNLQLADDSISRLEKLSQIQSEVIRLLPTFEKPSQTVYLLRKYDLQTLILIALQSPRKIRRGIWQYLTNWGNIQPLLNGNDLKQLGYKPSPQYKQMLDDLLIATVDGIIKNEAEAKEFLVKHYAG
ncbi:CBS domain-containing protein [Aphanizomenon flos-aquae NRERC-008]|uniref:CBS domain-containing protein n=1 Tax=Aphanizomenon flos-aquae FACHB-1249 TaxID=2692889 RepID=A0ABR8IP80_APHFL|nr:MULTISPECIES: CBS domain-containing protein [Aphanizomenon]MBD2389594.1 CBS domain-containing protein [Aphanizomenon flos-aquae FACHB-1171]MBD2556615.1 CBS domain-containing protein [Aphanizomenon flos-aquae FACHB-1290]MBD2630714.1 CBS domain-containing protein [Aphanizomenon sp. FACHB-1399]MBD2641621.1 CBS domain-containing protein [Aphanizomenon sp. FACHB-1401]MBD2656763.1 CBS domain-containing protein [Aphanizomenon flos-aquae FACHB-1265]